MTIEWQDPEEKLFPSEFFVSEDDWNLLKDLEANLNARLFAIENDSGGDTNFPRTGGILWYGVASQIPNGWHICDGTNGLPDLRGKFLMGATLDADVLTTDGYEQHSHDNGAVSIVGDHGHGYSISTGKPSSTANRQSPSASSAGVATAAHTHATSTRTTSQSGGHKHSLGNTSYASNLPPYKKFYFIGRID